MTKTSAEQSTVPEDRERLAIVTTEEQVAEWGDDLDYGDHPSDDELRQLFTDYRLLIAAIRQPVAAEVEALWREHAEWSEATFGTSAERGPLGPLRHLEKEVREAQAATNDIIEYTDCLMLVLDAARRAGFSLAELLDAWRRKLAINKARVWPKAAVDTAVEHVRLSPHATGEWRPTEEQIKHMVDRFLNWKLPENFNPDAGISFKATFNEHTAHPMKHRPSGTNLFGATEAEAMVRYMIQGMPAPPSPKDAGQ